eukprot:4466300-Prymnesium_polylepis.1
MQSSVEATMTTPLTTVAMQLVTSNRSLAVASDFVCSGLLPCVSCDEASSQGCNTATNCLELCAKQDGSTLSVFSFNALEEFLIGASPDIAWVGWMVGQIVTDYSINCGKSILQCASREICLGNCDTQCPYVANYTRLDVNFELYVTLAEMLLEGPVDLTAADGRDLERLFNRTQVRLGSPSLNSGGHFESNLQICAATNVALKNDLLSGGAGRRRRLPELEDEQDARAAPRTLGHLCEAASGRGVACTPVIGCMRRGATNYDS